MPAVRRSGPCLDLIKMEYIHYSTVFSFNSFGLPEDETYTVFTSS